MNIYLRAHCDWNKTRTYIKYLTLKTLELRISLFCLIKIVYVEHIARSKVHMDFWYSLNSNGAHVFNAKFI